MSNKSNKMEKNDVKLTKDDYNTFEVGVLDLDPELEKEIEEQGFAWRWINLQQYRSQGNFHKNRWTPYKRKDVKSDDFMPTTNEGFIIRGDCILAVRPIAIAIAHKKAIQAKNDRYKQYNKQQADDLRRTAKESGVKAKIHEGYEENE